MNLFSPQQRIRDPNRTPVPDPGEEDEIPASIADSSFYYYNKAFLLEKKNSKDGLVYYKENQSSNHWAYFWNQALIILMVEDRYYCRQDETLKSLITDLLNAFLEHEKNSKTNDTMDWTWNDFQDDLLWAGLASFVDIKLQVMNDSWNKQNGIGSFSTIADMIQHSVAVFGGALKKVTNQV